MNPADASPTSNLPEDLFSSPQHSRLEYSWLRHINPHSTIWPRQEAGRQLLSLALGKVGVSLREEVAAGDEVLCCCDEELAVAGSY